MSLYHSVLHGRAWIGLGVEQLIEKTGASSFAAAIGSMILPPHRKFYVGLIESIYLTVSLSAVMVMGMWGEFCKTNLISVMKADTVYITRAALGSDFIRCK